MEDLKQENERLNRCLLEALHHENKALNESIKLKERFKKHGELMLKCAKQRENYKQTLQEIKAIAEKTIDIYYPDYYDEGFEEDIVTEFAKQVLDLITKAEGNDV